MGNNNDKHTNRRAFLRTVSAGGVVGLAGLSGCIGTTDEDDGGDGGDGGDDGGDGGDDGGDDGTTTDDGGGMDFDTVQIGLLEPFSGDFAALAEESNQGSLLAIQEINESDEYDFEFEYEEYDTQINPEDGVAVATSAIERDGAQFLNGAISSSVALALNDVALENEVIYTPGAADVSITGSNCNEYVFRFETHTAQVAEMLSRWMSDQGWTNIHYQIADYAYGQSVKEEVGKRMERINGGGYQEVSTGAAELAASNFESFITQILDNSDEIDAVLVGATGGHLVRFLVQAAEVGLKEEVPIVTTTGSLRAIRAGGGEATVGTFGAARWTPTLEVGRNQHFVEAYREEHDAEATAFSRVSYGSIRMVANAIQEAGSRDPTVVKDVLAGMQHETVLGEVAFRECDHQASNPVWMTETKPPADEEIPALEILDMVSGEEAQVPCEETGCEL